jgi:predicted nuclease of predicted toxin-antitoxin system
MQFKIDENLHSDIATVLCAAQHDAMTVYEQGLRGCSDGDIALVCQQENRVIVTLDLDFSDIREFPPQNYAGIIVLRLSDQSRSGVLSVVTKLIPLFAIEPLVGHLWIVDERRVRIRGGSSSSNPL